MIVNAFVGGMIGLERTIIPQIAEADFGMAAKTAILSFIVFGVTAITNHKNLNYIGMSFKKQVENLLQFFR